MDFYLRCHGSGFFFNFLFSFSFSSIISVVSFQLHCTVLVRSRKSEVNMSNISIKMSCKSVYSIVESTIKNVQVVQLNSNVVPLETTSLTMWLSQLMKKYSVIHQDDLLKDMQSRLLSNRWNNTEKNHLHQMICVL